jgi:hypothetical protein
MTCRVGKMTERVGKQRSYTTQADKVTRQAIQKEQGWRSKYAGKGGGHAGKKGLAGNQVGHDRQPGKERQRRADNQGVWVGKTNGQQAVRQGSREADKLAKKGKHERRIQ